MASSAGKRTRCCIDSVPDPILEQIFSRLPHMDRLHLSELCSRWRDVARLDWLDVVDLDLTPIPSPNIGAVLRLSPNVESIFALRRFLIMNDMIEHYQTKLTSVKLYDVKMGLNSITGDAYDTDDLRDLAWFMGNGDMPTVSEEGFIGDICRVTVSPAAEFDAVRDTFATTLSRYLEKLPQLEELVLHNLGVTDLSMLPVTSVIPFSIQTRQRNVTRLQISGSGLQEAFSPSLLLQSLRSLPQLECLLLRVGLAVTSNEPYVNYIGAQEAFFAAVASLTNLRELCLAVSICQFDSDGRPFLFVPRFTADFARSLTKLEVLFLINQMCEAATFEALFTTHPTLRFLLLSVESDEDERVLSARKFNITAASQPLPFLHVFLGGEARHSLRFTESAAAKIILFDAPIPEFLASDEISAILDGVWVAEMIKETASNDPNFLER